MRKRHFIAAATVILTLLTTHVRGLDYGKPDGPVTIVVGSQPYYTQSWSAL